MYGLHTFNAEEAEQLQNKLKLNVHFSHFIHFQFYKGYIYEDVLYKMKESIVLYQIRGK